MAHVNAATVLDIQAPPPPRLPSGKVLSVLLCPLYRPNPDATSPRVRWHDERLRQAVSLGPSPILTLKRKTDAPYSSANSAFPV